MPVQMLNRARRQSGVSISTQPAATRDVEVDLELKHQPQEQDALRINAQFTHPRDVPPRNDQQVQCRVVLRRITAPGHPTVVLPDDNVVPWIELTERTSTSQCILYSPAVLSVLASSCQSSARLFIKTLNFQSFAQDSPHIYPKLGSRMFLPQK